MIQLKTLAVVLIALALFACAPTAAPTSTPPTTAAGQPTTAAAQPTTAGTPAPPTQTTTPGKVELILGAYSAPRDAYKKIIPLFVKYWKDKTGQDVEVQESYQGSGAQSRAIVGGFEADVAALALEADITRIQQAGLITSDWKAAAHNGIVSDSVAVIAVRKGNPKNIKDWNDLTQKDLQVLTPDPKVSGGAQWNILALWGAATRGTVTGVNKGDEAAAASFVKGVLTNVIALDKDARTSITNYEKGVGDAAITYESEAIGGKLAGADDEWVIPQSTILIELPVAVVDKYAVKHGVLPIAQGFRDFLFTPQAQQIFADYGFRSVDPDVAKANASNYPAVKDLFTIKDVGGWSDVTKKFFAQDGLYAQWIDAVQKAK